MKKVLLFVALMLVASTAFAQDGYIELLRSDLRTEKIAIVTDVMQLEGEQSEEFWKVYKEYDHAMSKVNDLRIAVIKDYAENYDKMTDEKALEIIAKSTEFQDKRMDLRKTYFTKFLEVLPATKAAKFMQLDHQISLLIDLQIAAELPLIPTPAEDD